MSIVCIEKRRKNIYSNEPKSVGLAIKGGSRQLNPGDIRYLKYVDNLNKEDVETTFVSSNTSVVSVSPEGVLTANDNLGAWNYGTAEITLTRGKYSTTITVIVEEDKTSKVFQKMKQRWLEYLLIDTSSSSVYSSAVENQVYELSAKANELWKNITFSSTEGRPLWSSSKTENGGIARDQFAGLRTLASAFVTEGTTLYQNNEVGRTVLNALEYLTGTGDYSEIDYGWTYNGANRSGGWWNWQIGASQSFCYVLLIMERYLENEEIVRYTDIINQYCFDPIMQLNNAGHFSSPAEPANLCDIAHCVLIQGLLRNNEEQVRRITDSDCVSAVMKTKKDYSSFGNGQYRDGSFIAHTSIAYTGSYGAEALNGISIFFNVLGGTDFDFSQETITEYYEYLLEAYLPLLYNGKMMSMVDGRAVSRANGGEGAEIALGRLVMKRLLILCKNSKAEYKKIIQGVVKWNLKKLVEYYGKSILGNEVIFFELLDEDSVKPMTYPHKMKIYGAMCRMVQVTDIYTAGVALSCEHISSYEVINEENLTGFYQGAGTLYVYNNDLDQYGGIYWPTQDPYRLPGVTADTQVINPTLINGQVWPPRTSANKVAGGVSNGIFGAVAYQFDASYLGLDTKARKSYFFLERGIVSIGTDISGTTTNRSTIETTIEARMLNESGSNNVLINGELFDDRNIKKIIHLVKGSWIHLEGNNNSNDDMAYYFPIDTDVVIGKVYQTGKYGDIKNDKTEEYAKEYGCWYLNIGINHGDGKVSDGKYVYVILPGMSVDEIRNYTKQNILEVMNGIVGNHESVHFIKNSNMFAFTCFGQKSYKVDWLLVSGENELIDACIIVIESSGIYTLSISDPSFCHNTLIVSIDHKIEVINKSDKITIAEDDKSFCVDTKDAGGQTFYITFRMEEDN